MRRMLFVLAAVLASSQAVAATRSPNVENTSFVMADGARTLQESIVIDAPVDILWKAFSDAGEFKRWNSPVAAIDFRVGGSLEASYDPKRSLGDPDNIKHRIVTFVPKRLIVFQNIQAPHALLDADLFQKTVTVVEYQPLGPTRTKVIVSSTGWGSDAKSDRLYRFFETGNAEILETMKRTYERTGPSPTP